MYTVPLQPAVHVQGQEPLTASMLAAAPPQEQKQMLGKNLRLMLNPGTGNAVIQLLRCYFNVGTCAGCLSSKSVILMVDLLHSKLQIKI